MTEQEALKLALEALEAHADFGIKSDKAITAIEEALAQPEQQWTDETAKVPDHVWDEKCVIGHCGWPSGCADSERCRADNTPAQQQEPVAMKFKIYKPTVPDPVRQGINNALLPWVYDQDRSSGFDATMWVTPVATLPPQRKPLTDEQVEYVIHEHTKLNPNQRDDRELIGYIINAVRAIEAAHGIKGEA